MSKETEITMPNPGAKRRIIVRTGCVTCKARRVKCDERKPTCHRCEKAGRVCEGYRAVKPPARTTQTTSSTTPIKPNTGATIHSPSQIQGPSLSTNPLILQPITLLFENERQKRYFNIFVNKTARQIAGSVGFQSWWDQTVPQTCFKEPSIRHAIIAIGALDLTADSGKIPGAEDRYEASEHHAFALQEYDRAIKLLRDQSSNREVDFRTAIIFCICCVCFEAFHGNMDGAITQLYSGFRLLLQAFLDRGEDTKNLLLGNSAPWIEQEIILTLRLVGFQGTGYFFDPRPLSWYEDTNNVCQQAIVDMPSVFESHRNARGCLQILARRCLYFLQHITQYDYEAHLYKDHAPRFTMMDPIVHPLSYIPPEAFEELQSYTRDLARWKQAFDSLGGIPETKGPEFILSATTKLHHNVLKILLANALSLMQTPYDTFLDIFKETIVLSEALLNHPDHYTKKGCFTFYSQHIMPLYICGLKCRDRAIRRKAVTLLQSSAQREGLWDSIAIAKLLEWVIQIEEQGIDINGYIPEASRVRGMNASFDLQSRRGKASCRLLRIDGGLEVRETFLTW